MVRIKKSKELLLQNPQIQIKEVALMAGFEDANIFIINEVNIYMQTSLFASNIQNKKMRNIDISKVNVTHSI